MKQQNWDTFITEAINNYMRDFQCMEILVPTGQRMTTRVHVHAPYMLQSPGAIDNKAAFNDLIKRHRDRLKRVKRAREHAPEPVKALLKRHFYAEDGHVTPVEHARAGPEDIHMLLQEAVTLGLLPAGWRKPYPDGHHLRQWLKKYGIGVDCSAFIQHALVRVVRVCYAGAGYGAPDTTLSGDHPQHVVGELMSHGVFGDIIGKPNSDDRFAPILTPGEARPGDVMAKPGHIRIVINTEFSSDGQMIMYLAECTTSKGIPVGQKRVETDIGPRRIEVQYPTPDQPIHEQVPLRIPPKGKMFKANSAETAYVLGRLRALAQFCEAHPAPLHTSKVIREDEYDH